MSKTDTPISGGTTPGPWRVDRKQSTAVRKFIGSAGGRGAGAPRNDGIWIAHVLGPDSEANARLIAAAPDLLAAAQASLKLLEKGAPGWGEAKDLLRSALSKALQP